MSIGDITEQTQKCVQVSKWGFCIDISVASSSLTTPNKARKPANSSSS